MNFYFFSGFKAAGHNGGKALLRLCRVAFPWSFFFLFWVPVYFIFIYIYVCIYIHIYVYVCVCVCVYSQGQLHSLRTISTPIHFYSIPFSKQCSRNIKSFFKRLYLFIYFWEKAKEGERGGEDYPCERETTVGRLFEAAAKAHSLSGNQTGDLSLCRMMPNQLSHTDQGWKLKNPDGILFFSNIL